MVRLLVTGAEEGVTDQKRILPTSATVSSSCMIINSGGSSQSAKYSYATFVFEGKLLEKTVNLPHISFEPVFIIEIAHNNIILDFIDNFNIASSENEEKCHIRSSHFSEKLAKDFSVLKVIRG